MVESDGGTSKLNFCGEGPLGTNRVCQTIQEMEPNGEVKVK